MSQTTVIRSEIRNIIMVSGTPNSYRATELSCGHWCAADLAPGAAFDCEHCDREATARATIREAHAAGRLSHTRAGGPGNICRGRIVVYGRDKNSPTGVLHLASLDDTPANYAFLRALGGGLSPLSPTEGLQR